MRVLGTAQPVGLVGRHRARLVGADRGEVDLASLGAVGEDRALLVAVRRPRPAPAGRDRSPACPACRPVPGSPTSTCGPAVRVARGGVGHVVDVDRAGDARTMPEPDDHADRRRRARRCRQASRPRARTTPRGVMPGESVQHAAEVRRVGRAGLEAVEVVADDQPADAVRGEERREGLAGVTGLDGAGDRVEEDDVAGLGQRDHVAHRPRAVGEPLEHVVVDVAPLVDAERRRGELQGDGAVVVVLEVVGDLVPVVRHGVRSLARRHPVLGPGQQHRDHGEHGGRPGGCGCPAWCRGRGRRSGSIASTWASPSTSGIRSTTSNLCRLRSAASGPSSHGAPGRRSEAGQVARRSRSRRCTTPVSRPQVRKRWCGLLRSAMPTSPKDATIAASSIRNGVVTSCWPAGKSMPAK